jgi:hypothetical protein
MKILILYHTLVNSILLDQEKCVQSVKKSLLMKENRLTFTQHELVVYKYLIGITLMELLQIVSISVFISFLKFTN